MQWWQKTIVYECYPKSFLDTEGKGTGTIRGITEKLGYLSSLGVGAVWLTPVYASPMVDGGYDVADYDAIDPSFGTMADMQELIREAGKLDIHIVMDLVFNHTSEKNAWFLTSRKDRTNAKADWYIWRDPKADGSAPTNWRSIFGGSAWTWCEERGQYYLHTFASAQPDLNWANPEVRKAVADVTNFWVDQGAGGFRIDAITYIRKPDVFADGPVDGEDGLSSIHALTANTPGILDYLSEYRAAIKKKGIDGKDLFMVAEANGVPADQLDAWVGHKGVFDLLFEFSHIDLQFPQGEVWCRPYAWNLKDLKKAIFTSEAKTASNGWYPVFFENHDQPRSIDHYFPNGSDSLNEAKVLGALLYTLRGTPFLYQGEELGMTNTAWDSIDAYEDISSKGQYAFALQEGFTQAEALSFVHSWSRDNARTPMQWNGEKNAGFTEGKPWLPVHEDYMIQNVQMESEDLHSVLNWYRKLHQLRQKESALTQGSLKPIMEDSEEVFAFEREDEKERIAVYANWTAHSVPVPQDGTCILTNLSDTCGTLLPYQVKIMKKEK